MFPDVSSTRFSHTVKSLVEERGRTYTFDKMPTGEDVRAGRVQFLDVKTSPYSSTYYFFSFVMPDSSLRIFSRFSSALPYSAQFPWRK